MARRSSPFLADHLDHLPSWRDFAEDKVNLGHLLRSKLKLAKIRLPEHFEPVEVDGTVHMNLVNLIFLRLLIKFAIFKTNGTPSFFFREHTNISNFPEEVQQFYCTILFFFSGENEEGRNRVEQYTPRLLRNFEAKDVAPIIDTCLLYTSPSPRDKRQSRMPSSA